MKNQYIKIAIIVLIASVISYNFGLKNGQASTTLSSNQNRTGQFSGRGGNSGIRGANGSFTSGQVISKDSNTLTLQLRSGGSINILYASSTQIQKSATGTISDISTGTQVMVSGTANADGSISAQNIQIRPESTSSSTNTFGR